MTRAHVSTQSRRTCHGIIAVLLMLGVGLYPIIAHIHCACAICEVSVLVPIQVAWVSNYDDICHPFGHAFAPWHAQPKPTPSTRCSSSIDCCTAVPTRFPTHCSLKTLSSTPTTFFRSSTRCFVAFASRPSPSHPSPAHSDSHARHSTKRKPPLSEPVSRDCCPTSAGLALRTRCRHPSSSSFVSNVSSTPAHHPPSSHARCSNASVCRFIHEASNEPCLAQKKKRRSRFIGAIIPAARTAAGTSTSGLRDAASRRSRAFAPALGLDASKSARDDRAGDACVDRRVCFATGSLARRTAGPGPPAALLR